ncbi:MAG: glycosyltransferase family 4 protein [Azonexaceae bacterium]|nr:glycosyltransferase family 4 protein [Azonexaceae bacterium]
MSAVSAAYRDGGLFDQYRIIYVSPVGYGSRFHKMAAALVAAFRFLGALLFCRVGLVHVHVASGISFWRKAFFVLLAYSFFRPVILHVHGGNFVEFFANLPSIGQRFVRWLFGRARNIVVLSQAWVGRLEGIVSPSKCVVIENPVIPPLTTHKIKDASGEVVFVFLGRLEKDKGVYDLLAAFADVVRVFPCARLVLCGNGELDVCQRRAADLGITDKVVFPGWVVGEEKQRLLRESDVFVLPSHIEGLPISMLEAMSFGLPVVICPVGSIPETIQNQAEALFVPVGDVWALSAAMLNLAQDPALRIDMGRRGETKFCESYSVQSVLPRICDLYEKILGNNAIGSK